MNFFFFERVRVQKDPEAASFISDVQITKKSKRKLEKGDKIPDIKARPSRR
jgi:hypothetical protein